MRIDQRAVRITPNAALAALGVLTAGCAGATYRSGVGDRQLDRPPYYAGRTIGPEIGPIAYLPITYQRGASQDPMLDPVGDDGSAVATLLAEMNARLDSLAHARATPLLAVGPGPEGAPDVRFGCDTDASGDCEWDETHDPGRPLSHISVARPTGPWVEWAGGALDRVGASHLLVLTLEVGQLWPRQKNLRGDKVVELGTNYAVALPWLTSLETPITVVQISGALVDRDGRAVRIGAEGLLPKQTGLLISSLGAQALIADEDVTRLRTERRTDLPGAPLVWEAALNVLLGQLAGGASQ